MELTATRGDASSPGMNCFINCLHFVSKREPDSLCFLQGVLYVSSIFLFLSYIITIVSYLHCFNIP